MIAPKTSIPGCPRRVVRRCVRHREMLGDERAPGRDPLVHPPRAAGVLHGREADDGDDPDHRASTNATRSPRASVAPERGSNSGAPVAVPRRCQPPGDENG